MQNRLVYLFARINLVLMLALFLTAGAVNAQGFPQGLIGLSSADVGVLYTISPNTGQATPFVTTDGETSIVGLSYIEGTLYGVDLEDYPGSPIPDEFTIGSIATNGVITFLGDQNGSSNWWGLASDDCGENILYSTDEDNESILTVQFPNGNTQTIGVGSGLEFAGLAYDDANEILYGLNVEGNLYTISTTTGDTSLVGATGVSEPGNNMGLAYDERNEILYANNSIELYSLNVNTGASTLIGPNNADGEQIDGLAWLDTCGPSPVPTLSEWGLIAMAGVLGVVGFMVMRRRQVAA
ncbi:MAG: hypothetical protein DHS20C13_03020 [Thermodesulfobacteriota bacterium]|nr:MAG: hypothetical protein DHS20C13_03020 [Thermodesulfobacteriota bacterium]